MGAVGIVTRLFSENRPLFTVFVTISAECLVLKRSFSVSVLVGPT